MILNNKSVELIILITSSCIKYFARNNLIIDFEKQKRIVKKRDQEYRGKMKEKTWEVLKSKENCFNITHRKIWIFLNLSFNTFFSWNFLNEIFDCSNWVLTQFFC
jgi:hypothetical protein